MLEKLNIIFIKKNHKLNVYELELFIELLNNQINWNLLLDIMNLTYDDQDTLKRIDNDALHIYEISQSQIPKTYRFDWIIKRTINKKWLIESLKKSFIYPIFLWLLSLNLITFLVIYILPSTLKTFDSFSTNNTSLHLLLVIIQFVIGLEWGVLLISIYMLYTTKMNKQTRFYIKMYQKYKSNLCVNILSFTYLFDLNYLLNLDLKIESLMSILKSINFPMYFEISENVLTKLRQGQSIKVSFEYLDLTFIKLLKIDDYERKISDRINQHLTILRKQIEIGIKKYAAIYTSFVYIQIGLMVFMVYSILLYPLKLMEGMNL